jgi:hypothetical protein
VRLVVETPLPGDLRMSLARCGGPNVLKFLEGKAALGGAGPSTLPPPPPSGGPTSSRDSRSMPAISERNSSGDRISHEPPDVDAAPMSIRPPIQGAGDDD